MSTGTNSSSKQSKVPSFPYRRFAVVGSEVNVGEVFLQRGEEGSSHADLLEQLAGPGWAERLDETACGWLLGAHPPYEVSIAYYTAGGLERESARAAIERWAERTNIRLIFRK